MVIPIDSVHNVMEGGYDFARLRIGYIQKSAPNFDAGKTAGREASNDSKIIRTCFEGTPEIRILGCGGCGKGSGCEDNVVADYFRTY